MKKGTTAVKPNFHQIVEVWDGTKFKAAFYVMDSHQRDVVTKAIKQSGVPTWKIRWRCTTDSAIG